MSSALIRKDSRVEYTPSSPTIKKPADRSSSPDIKAKKSGKKSILKPLEDDPELSIYKSDFKPIYLTHDPDIAELDNKLRRK